MSSNSSPDLILETSLQCYFFDQLSELNKKCSSPLANEDIFYSSLVMDKFGMAQRFLNVPGWQIFPVALPWF